MNCAFSSKYFCTEHFVFLTMLSKITSKYILGIPYGQKLTKMGQLCCKKLYFIMYPPKKCMLSFEPSTVNCVERCNKPVFVY